jgi:hypothetical protein
MGMRKPVNIYRRSQHTWGANGNEKTSKESQPKVPRLYTPNPGSGIAKPISGRHGN